MRRSSISLRWRLTAWYIALLASVLLAFSTAVYVALDRQLREAEDDALQNLALLLDRAVDVTSGQLRFTDLSQTTKRNERFVRMYDTAGHMVFDSSADVGSVPALPTNTAHALAGNRNFTTVRVAAHQFRVMVVPIQRNGEIVGALHVAESLDEEAKTLRRLLVILVVTVPITLALASWVGALLTGRALAPLDTLTHAAQQISAQDLSQRLAPPVRNDEIGRLTTTFDLMIARLDQSFRRQLQFTADASHELRTPLTVVRGQIEVALSRPRNGATYRATLQEVLRQIDRMSRLVADLLTLARTDAHTLPLYREQFDLAQLTTDVAAQLQPLAAARSIRLDCDAPACVPIFADEDRLLQVLFNLLDNALAHSPDGSVITLLCGIVEGQAQIVVRDSGTGVPAEHLPHLFERFYRVDTSRSRQQGGAGLGLAIVRSLIEAHGGSVTARNEAGYGAIFVVRLPLEGAANAARG